MSKNKNYISSLKAWNLDDLVDHVLNTHHAYLKANYPLIHQLIDKLISQEPGNETAQKINKLYSHFTSDLARHLIKEEEILFPYFKTLGQIKDKESFEPASFGSLPKPIEMMENEHDDSHTQFEQIKKITNNFTPDQGASPVTHSLYFKLKEFDDDMEIHHELENEILFAKAREIEEQFGV
jgi:regulator of cell morphogenesis and NO signaling